MQTCVYFYEDRLNGYFGFIVHRPGEQPSAALLKDDADIEEWKGYWAEDEPDALVYHFVRDDEPDGYKMYDDKGMPAARLNTVPHKRYADAQT